ncbi:MAG: HYR domain-containing protein [Candidatus Cyclobacteriaceae bacterium M2_1C_046]
MHCAKILPVEGGKKLFLLTLLVCVNFYAQAQSCDNDTSAPVIANCPEDINVNNSPDSECGAKAYWDEPTASDNCSVTLTSTHKPGDFFPRGKTTVTYTATDTAGNITTCSFNVIANDNIKPVISGCPTEDIVVTADPDNGSCGTYVYWDEITVTDNCDSVTLTTTHNSGDFFKIGETKVTYTATDLTDNSTKCSFIVTVTESGSPVSLKCPEDIVSTADSLCQAVVRWTEPSINDHCEYNLTSNHFPGDTFYLGTTTVTYIATDVEGDSITCSFDVIVNDEMAPVLSDCPSDIILTVDTTCEAIVSWTPPTASDNCSVTLTSTHNSGDIFPLGTTTVTYTAMDVAGNSNTCSFNVIVKDEIPPVILHCPSEIIVYANTFCEATVSWEPPTTTDNCSVTLSSTHNPGDNFQYGITTVLYTATDDSGNIAVCKFDVIVRNEQPPIFTGCPEDIYLETDESGQAIGEWEVPGVEVACGDVIVESSHEPGDYFPVGITEVEYTATDENGYKSTCSFNINVVQKNLEFKVIKFFTPNGDGQNDVWELSNIENFRDNTVVIVDRWGSEVYKASGYDNERIVWTGLNKNGNPVPTGTYYYFITVTFRSEVIERKGFIELVR